MRPSIRIVLEVLSAIVTGVLTSFVIEQPYVNFAVGITTFLTLEILRIGMGVERMDHSLAILAQVASSFQRPVRNNLDSFFYTLLLSSLNDNIHKVEPHSIRVPPSEGHSFWLRLLPNVESTYYATTFTELTEGWARAFSDKGMALHREKLELGVQFNRVFIVDNADELAKIRPILEMQKELGIKVRYIDLAKLKKLRIVSQNFRRLGTYDFAILDQTHVFRVFLDKQRKWTGLELNSDESILALAKEVFQEIWGESAEL